MMEEILSRLPLKSIARFKSVSKKWKWTLESSSWSLQYEEKEVLGFHGCETWDLPKHPASFKRYFSMGFSFEEFNCRAYSNGLVLIENLNNMCIVGNPVLQQWVNISKAPNYSIPSGLVTQVLSLVSTTETWSVFVYSSETGVWTCRNIHCPHKTIYLSCFSGPTQLIAYDFYSESDQFRISIP